MRKIRNIFRHCSSLLLTILMVCGLCFGITHSIWAAEIPPSLLSPIIIPAEENAADVSVIDDDTYSLVMKELSEETDVNTVLGVEEENAADDFIVLPNDDSSDTYSLPEELFDDEDDAELNEEDYDFEIESLLINEEEAPEVFISSNVEKKTIAPNTSYATELYIINGSRSGPVVLITGGIHGNETAGYTAAKKMVNTTVKSGTLLVIPEVNKKAIAEKKRTAASGTDLNRAFPTSATGSCSTSLAKAVYEVVQDYDVDWLMDMHEGYDYYKNKSTNSVGQSLIYYPDSAVTRKNVSTVVDTLNQNISKPSKQFSLLRYPAKGSLARASGQYLGVHSFIFETCQKESLNTRVENQLKVADKLLSLLNMK